MDDKEKIPTPEATPVVKGEDNKIVDTYAEDMARVIGDDQAGLIKKIIHEEEMNEEMKKQLSPESTQNKLYMTFGLLFLFVALIIWISVLLKNEPAVVVPEEKFSPLITLDKSSFVDVTALSKDQVISKISSEVKNSLLQDGDLEGIYLASDKRILGLREFFSLLESSLVYGDDAIFSDSFLLGFTKNKTRDLFILIKVKSFQDIFSHMRAWEEKVYIDLGQLFDLGQENYLLTKDFSDGFMENKNARILYDKDDNIVLMYVYVDDNSIVITTTREVVRGVIDRIFSSQIENN